MKPMTCGQCGIEMVPRRATLAQPYPYRMSGLSNLYLVGIEVSQCPNCEAESPLIPRIAELHRQVAKILLLKPAPLTGEELRFLRKNAGLSASRFATLLRIDAAYLSRFENGHHRSLGGGADKLARALVAAATGDETLGKILLSLAANLHGKARKREAARVSLRLAGNHWRNAAA